MLKFNNVYVSISFILLCKAKTKVKLPRYRHAGAKGRVGIAPTHS
jgi:hypothetical protein